jgi:hypothetical protein
MHTIEEKSDFRLCVVLQCDRKSLLLVAVVSLRAVLCIYHKMFVNMSHEGTPGNSTGNEMPLLRSPVVHVLIIVAAAGLWGSWGCWELLVALLLLRLHICCVGVNMMLLRLLQLVFLGLHLGVSHVVVMHCGVCLSLQARQQQQMWLACSAGSCRRTHHVVLNSIINASTSHGSHICSQTKLTSVL